MSRDIPASIRMGDLPPDAAKALNDMLPQVLIAIVKARGGVVKVPVAAVDKTGDSVLAIGIENGVFVLTARKKQ